MNNIVQYVVAVVLVAALFALFDPFMYWMPDMLEMATLVVVFALTVIWIGLVAREEDGDEREILHRMYAGRVAYLSGIIILTLALVVQGLSHVVDPWVPCALVVMIISKLGTRWYSDRFW